MRVKECWVVLSIRLEFQQTTLKYMMQLPTFMLGLLIIVSATIANIHFIVPMSLKIQCRSGLRHTEFVKPNPNLHIQTGVHIIN